MSGVLAPELGRTKKNKLRWYPQQPKHWKHLSLLQSPPDSRTFSGTLLNLTWLCTKASQTFPGTFSGTFSGTVLNVTWLCTKASEPSEPSPEYR